MALKDLGFCASHKSYTCFKHVYIQTRLCDNINVLLYKGCWLGLSRKNIMANEIAGFGDLNLFILNELAIKYVIEFGRFVRILEGQWKW